MNIFDFKNYSSYMKNRLKNPSDGGHGSKSRLAEYLGCLPAHISQVLSEKSQLSLEQAVLVNEFFLHTEDESAYFLLLVQYSRAGSKKLRDYFYQQIVQKKSEIQEQNKSYAKTGQVPRELQEAYYSTWYYSAIHLLLALPEYSDPKKISQRLNIETEEVLKVIETLLKSGLIVRKNTGYIFSEDRVYLGRDEISIKHHHINWRTRSLHAAGENLKSNLHYSNVLCISKSDFEIIKNVLIDAVKKTREITGPSKEEEVYALTLDLFKI